MSTTSATYTVRDMEPHEVDEFISICRQSSLWTLHSSKLLLLRNACPHAFLVAISPTGQIVGTCCLFYVTPNRGLISGLGTLLNYHNAEEVRMKLLLEITSRLPSEFAYDMVVPLSLEDRLESLIYRKNWEIVLYVAHVSTIRMPEVDSSEEYHLQREEALTQEFLLYYYSRDWTFKTMNVDCRKVNKEARYLLVREGFVVGYGEAMHSEDDACVIGPVIASNQTEANLIWKELFSYVKSVESIEKVFTYVQRQNSTNRNFLERNRFSRAEELWARYSGGSVCDTIVEGLKYSDAMFVCFALDSIVYSPY